MEFLLFLCAALTALTGAITGTRTPDMPVQIEQSAPGMRVGVANVAQSVAAILGVQRVGNVRAVRSIVFARPFALRAAFPIFAWRRRE